MKTGLLLLMVMQVAAAPITQVAAQDARRVTGEEQARTAFVVSPQGNATTDSRSLVSPSRLSTRSVGSHCRGCSRCHRIDV